MSSRQSAFQLKFTRKRSKSLCSMVTSEKGNEAKVTPIDFRTKIENISLFPYTCIGKILCKFVDGRGKAHIKKGTASKIGSNILLTAAHVIFCPEMQKVADQIYYYPAQILERDKNSYSKKQGIKVTNLYINPIYFNKEAKDKSMFDFALLELQQNQYLGKPEFLKINFDFIPQDNQDVRITVSGFSEHPDDEKYLIFQEESQTLQSNENDFIYYLHTTYQGYSGAPILLRGEGDSVQLVGIHKGTLSQKNYGISMNHLATNEKYLTECIKSNFMNWFQLAKISFKALLSMFLKSQKISLQTIKEMKNKLQTTENNFKNYVWEGFMGNKNFGNFQKGSHPSVNPAQKQVGESASEIFEIKKELSEKNEQNMNLLQQNNNLKKQIKQLRTQMQDRMRQNVIMFQHGIQRAKQQFQINSQRIELQVKQKIKSNLEKINKINEKMSEWRNDKCELNRLCKKLEQIEETQKKLREDIALLNKKIADESGLKSQQKQFLTVPKQLEETLSLNNSHQLSFKDTLLESSMEKQNNSSDSSLKLNNFKNMKTLSEWENTGLDSSKNLVHSQPNLLHAKSKSKFKSKTTHQLQGQIMEVDFNVIVGPRQNEKDIKELLNPMEYLKAYCSKDISKIYYKSDKLRIQHSKEKYNIILSPQGYNLYLTNFNVHIGEFFAYNWLNLEFLSLSYCQIDDLKWEKFSFLAKKFLPNLLALDFHGNTITTVKKEHLESFGKVRKIWFTLKSKQSLLTEQSKLEIQQFKRERLQKKLQVKIRC